MDIDSVRIGVDVGSSKTVAVISEYDVSSGMLLILGVGVVKNTGNLKRGKVVDLNATAVSIQKACSEAVMMSGIEVNSAYINIPGEVEGVSSQGIVTIASKNREITIKDIQRVLQQARTMNISSEKVVVHLLPQYFNVDDQENIQDPIGMTGLRLQGFIHIILSSKRNVTNIIKCFQGANIAPLEGFFNGYASANAVLTGDEKDLGVVLLDIGASTVDITVFQNGYVVYVGVIPIAGESITRDLSIGLKIPELVAEKIKIEEGIAYDKLVDPLSEIEIPSMRKGEFRTITQEVVNNIIQARVEEIFILIKRQLENNGIILRHMAAGVVITGGSANLQGIVEVSESILHVQSKIGLFTKLGGLSEKVDGTSFSTVLGLCLKNENSEVAGSKTYNFGSSRGKRKTVGKFVSFLKDMFG